MQRVINNNNVFFRSIQENIQVFNIPGPPEIILEDYAVLSVQPLHNQAIHRVNIIQNGIRIALQAGSVDHYLIELRKSFQAFYYIGAQFDLN